MSSPTLRELLKDPAFKRQFSKPPGIKRNLAHGTPYIVWALNHQGKWAKADCATYAAAFDVVKRGLARRVDGTDAPFYVDMAIVSKRQFFGPRADVTWAPELAWCSRCQRPVRFGRFSKHHARANSPMAENLADDPRCPYCGIRREAMKEYSNNGG